MTDSTPAEAPKRYAVYNTTLERFVGGVTSSKPTATDAKALVPEGHKVEVREVQ